MSRRFVLAWVLVAAAGVPVRAQVPFARDLVPTRTALGRLGLERQWLAVVPLRNEERLMTVSLSEDLLFAQTNRANFYAYNAETGQALWTARLGNQSANSRPASVNSFAVFVTNMNTLYALDRRTGVPIWTTGLKSQPSSATSCDEDRVMVGLSDGMIHAFDLKVKDTRTGRVSLAGRAQEVWNWQTGGPIRTRPLPASRVVAFGSDDGRVYVTRSEERVMLYRIATGGAIGAGLGYQGTRLLLAPSADRNLYGIDLLTAQVLWTYPSGAPIDQEPLSSGEDIFVVNTAGLMTSIDPASGSPRWSTSTQGGRLLSIGAKRVYLESQDGDLFLVDRATGQMVADARATLGRAGLNLRSYDLSPTNRLNDRLYFGTTSGLILAIREIGQTRPRPLRDPKAPPFGYIPVEGVSLTPPAPPAAEPAPAPPGEGNPAPGDEKPAEPAAPPEEKGAEPGDRPAEAEPAAAPK